MKVLPFTTFHGVMHPKTLRREKEDVSFGWYFQHLKLRQNWLDYARGRCGCSCKCQPGSVLPILDRASAHSIMTFHEWLPIHGYFKHGVFRRNRQCCRGYHTTVRALTMRRLRPPKAIFTCRHLRSIVLCRLRTKETSFGLSRREKFLHHRRRQCRWRRY